MKTGLEELEQYTLTRSQYAKRIGKTTNAVRMMMRHGKLLGEFRFDGSKFLFKDPKRPREYKGQYHGQRPPKERLIGAIMRMQITRMRPLEITMMPKS